MFVTNLLIQRKCSRIQLKYSVSGRSYELATSNIDEQISKAN